MSDDFLRKPFSLAPAAPVEEGATTNYTPVTSTFSSAPVSPYLNYDSRFLQQAQPEFIFPEGANKQRGRFELAFSQIGTSVMIGGGIGGVAGVYNGFKVTKALNQTGKLRRTHKVRERQTLWVLWRCYIRRVECCCSSFVGKMTMLIQ
ncbi:mitochondrial import inner membrane translocase subunit Tim23 isoform X2 [Drosophila bipectinata]|uniref:mitochondrial import inner membrane translocase subunit Tim23 isoform X2 n=1 Tax=Drosophila bipectinata TaxID=42026 RepID=UPI0038B2E7BC